MNKHILILTLLIFSFHQGLFSQKPCYKALVEKGEGLLNTDPPQYKEAFEHFIAARNCWDIGRDIWDIDGQIDTTSTRWTDDLTAKRLRAEAAEHVAENRRKEAEIEKAKAEKSDAISKSYLHGYDSQKALEKNNSSDALWYGYEAIKIIEDYNINQLDSNKIQMPSFVIETFGNAVFGSKEKKEIFTQQPALIGFGMTAQKDRFFTLGRDSIALKIWNIDGTLVDSIIAKNSEFIHAASFSENGQQLIACFRGGQSRIWSSQSSPLLLDHDTTIVQGKFIFDQRVLTIDRKGHAQIWNKDDTKKEKEITDVPLLEVKLNKSKTIAFLRSAYEVFIWNLEDSEQDVKALLQSPTYLYGMELSPKEDYILTYSAGGIAEIWDLEANSKYKAKHNGVAILTAAFYPQKEEFITGSQEGVVSFVNYGKHQEVLASKSNAHNRQVQKVLVSYNGKNSISVAADSSFHIIAGSKKYEGRHGGKITSSSFSSDNVKVLLSSDDGIAKLWSVKGDILMTMPLKGIPLQSEFYDSGNQIIIVTRNGKVYLVPSPEVVLAAIKSGKIQLKESKTKSKD